MNMQPPVNKPSETRDLQLSREFNAPREVIWQAWTHPERLVKWFAPEHFTTPAAKVDLRPGGQFLYCMRSPEGVEFWGKGMYREVVPPERLVYVDSFADEEGNPVTPDQYGLSPDFPQETLVTVTFADRSGKTLLTLLHAGLPAGQSSDMTEAGWQSQLDKLAAVAA